MGIPRTRRTGARPAGSPSRRSCAPSPGFPSVRRSARTKSCFWLGSCSITLQYSYVPFPQTHATTGALVESIGLGGFSGLPDALYRQTIGAEDQEGAPDPRQERPRHLDRHQGAQDGPDHSPTAHHQRRPKQHVAFAQVGEAADDRGRHDGEQRGALGHRLRKPESDRHRGHEQQPAPDADGAAEEACAEPTRYHQKVEPAHGKSSYFRPTTPSTSETANFSWRSVMRLRARAPT